MLAVTSLKLCTVSATKLLLLLLLLLLIEVTFIHNNTPCTTLFTTDALCRSVCVSALFDVRGLELE